MYEIETGHINKLRDVRAMEKLYLDLRDRTGNDEIRRRTRVI